MMDRYTIHASPEEISGRFGIEVDDYYLPSYNAAPTQKLPVVVNAAKGGLSYLHWGSNASWSNNKSISVKLIGAPLDQLFTKATLKSAIKSKRCIIPVTGFYLWKLVGKKSKRPYYFRLPGEELFSLAGLWEEYEDLDGKANHTFKIINIKHDFEEVGFGNELPFILDKTSEKQWLSDEFSPETDVDILPLRLETNFTYHIVAPHISNLKINSPKLIEPQPPIDQLGNFTLFE